MSFPSQFIHSQKQKLLHLKEEVLNNIHHQGLREVVVDKDQTVEDGDQAKTYLEQNLTFGLRQRDIHRLREIESALERIEQGTYGLCEDTDEPISQKRLEKMPWARLSIAAAEERERQHGHKRAI